MNQPSRFLPLLCVCYWASMAVTRGNEIVLDFEDVPLAPDSVLVGDATQAPLVFQGVTFNRTYAVEFDCCPGAWGVSNRTDLSTIGFSNALSAYHLPTGGGGDGSSNYLVANDDGITDATVEFAQPVAPQGMYVTNSTYAYLAVAAGDDGAGFVKGAFAADDYFRLTVRGLDADQQVTGTSELFLADFRDGASHVLDNWTWLDLTPLGSQVSALSFELDSTDVGMFGMNTPAYFAVDNLTFSVVPEPTAQWLLCCGVISLLRARSRHVRTRAQPTGLGRDGASTAAVCAPGSGC